MRKLCTYLLCLLLGSSAAAQNVPRLVDAVQTYSEGDFHKAKTAFEMLHAKDTTDDASLYYLGMCEYHTGDFGNSERHLSRAAAIDSVNTWYLGALANLYNTTGRISEAARICKKLVDLNATTYKNSYTYCLVGDQMLHERKDSLAERFYRMSLEMDPDYAPAQIGLSETMRLRGNYPGYFLALDSFIENDSVDADMKSGYMENLMSNIDSKFWWVWGDQITKLINRCVELHPEDIAAHINKGQVCYIHGDRDGMAAEFAAIIPLAEEQRDTTNLLMALSTTGDWLYEKGQHKEAYKTYERALKIKPDYAPVLNNYAYFLSEENKNLKKALKMSTIVVRNNPDNATYLDTHAWILHLLGRDKEAKPYFKHAMIYGGKDSAVVLDHYAQVLKALGEMDLYEYYKSLAAQKK